MDIKEIVIRLSAFFVPAAILGIGVLVLSFIVIKMRKKKGMNPSSGGKKKAIIGSLLVAYYFIVIGITNLSRGESFSGQVNLNIFSGYIDAWNSFSLISFQLIVFNVLMFVPLGILLPLYSRRFMQFKWTFAATFLATLLIEIFQVVTGRGIFELDDIFHNTLGGVLGYQLFMLSHDIIRNKTISLKPLTKRLALPMILLFAFAGWFSFYHFKEFGNMSINPTYGTDMEKVTLSTTLELNSEKAYAPVYKNKYSNDEEHGRDVVENLQKTLRLPKLAEEGREGDNRMFTFEKEQGTDYQMSYYMRDGTWSLMDHEFLPENVTYENSEEMKAYATEMLARLDLLPKQADLTISETGTFHWMIQPSTYSSSEIEDGVIMMDLKKDGSVASLFYSNTVNEFVRDVEILSPKEAYAKIENGDFDQYNPLQKGDQLVVTDCQLDYMYDSKGFYQPIYSFSGTLNEEEWSLHVTAMK